MRIFKLPILIIIISSILIACKSPFENSFEKQFVINDTLNIQSIKISGDSDFILKRTGNSWELNDGLPVNQVAINNLLLSLSRMEKMGVSTSFESSASENILFTIETKKRTYKLSFYFFEDEAYIGKVDSDEVNRFGIKGLPNIKLSDVFSGSEVHWKKPMLMNYSPTDIKEINTIPNTNWGDAFYIRKNVEEWSIFDGNGIEANNDSTDKAKLVDYCRNFMEIYYEQEIIDNDFYAETISGNVFFSISIKTESGIEFQLNIYPNHNEEGYYDDFYALATKSGSKSLYLVNYVFLDPMFESYRSFLKK